MAVTMQMIKDLREKTGAGVLDCKNTLTETDGDIDKAIEILRKKGLAAAAKKATRVAAQGRIDAYIHAGDKLGTLVEVNCETDFVARTEGFQQFAKDLSMHIAAEQPLAVDRESVDPALVEHEKGIYGEQAKNEGKPDHIAEKIIQGRLEKYFQDICLMEQAFVKDSDRTIEDLVTELSAKVGEKVSIARFVCFRLGDTN